MTPLELSYPLSGLVLALGSGIYVWNSRRALEKKLAQSQPSDQPPTLIAGSGTPAVKEVAPENDGESPEAVIHAKGKLRRLEKDLQSVQASLENALAERNQLTENYQAQEKMVAALQHQLAHYDDIQSEKFVGLQKLNQELLQENTNLSDRLKQAVNEVAETRPKLVQLNSLVTRNQQLSDQLSYVEQNQAKAIEQRLASQEKLWQQRHEQEQAQWNSQASQWEEQVRQLTAERDQVQQELQTARQQSQSAQTQAENLQAALDRLGQQEEQWQGERSQLTAKLNQLEEAQKELALANAELKVKLETTQAEGDRLKTEKKEQAAALQSAQGQVTQLQQELAALQENLAKAKGEPPSEVPEKTKAVATAPAQEAPVVSPSPPVTVEVKQESPKSVQAEKVEPEPEPTPVPPAAQATKAPASPAKKSTAKAVDEVLDQEEKQVKAVEKTEPPRENKTVAPVATSEDVAPTVETETITDPVATVPSNEEGAHPLAEKKVVILGTLNAMNREEAKTRLQNVGAECTGTPSGKTDYIVVGKAPGAKLKKAQKLGIAQLSEAQFLELLGD
ncbi:DNA ligase [Synechocystis sp. PCC 6803]|uniref:DNA ligase n=1 Tax=Synechocystis sp. (strain ATCC 27184 / PCC 6803 / Kazusa) TaxID=1111708 RepID=P73196_SYNY3|nr:MULTISPECIES: BRCT domain-containing protein [unclassified Synechocystis]BAM50942.1 DNA ligase [Synechocystis sp. PCC 6803] [Bacillus subtilis BEST7613]AGF50912.1 DNA ligase [Synechocystis sp. PCC 6803]ALJ66960.1 DNA ligase [Synechocystis sp. PCC 6803]AVP88802.1 DNA ligase [Synechocystis sp. IPPAS B-1465]MBD2617314.1 DNA ligase [Synechocystis sp. FACHB-898]